MRITVDLPDELHERAKAEAARRGCTLRDLVTEGLNRVLDKLSRDSPKATLANLMRPARGIVDTGVTDRATNPKHLAGFGRDVRGR